MSKTIKHFLIALAVAIVAGAAFGFLDNLSGSPSPTTSYLPVVFAGLTFFALQMRSGNRKEVRVDDANRQASLNAVAAPGQALLYVYREGFVGKVVGWNVCLDGNALAQLRSPRFTHTTLSPGSHTLNVALSGFAGAQHNPGEARFDAQPGEVIVFAIKAKMGALKSTLFFVREQDTRIALQKLAKVPMVAAEQTPQATAA
jgi:hypothetical protein